MTADELADERPGPAVARAATAWASVAVLTATSFALVTGEFLPPSLLPALAADLGTTEGRAGQAVTATAFAALLTAPTIGLLVPRLERRTLLSALAVAAGLSNIGVALSGDLAVLLLSRLLLGAAVGGFWAMSLAVAAQLTAPRHLGRAITAVNTGGTLATVAGVPLGIWLDALVDWRTVFAGVGVLTLGVAVTLRLVLPEVPAAASTGLRALGRTLGLPGVALGLLGHALVMLGNFAAFTYVRAALGIDPSLGTGDAALLIATFGVASLVGGVVTGIVVDRHLRALRRGAPVLLAAAVAALVPAAGHPWLLTTAVVVWGAVFGGWLIVVTAWIGRAAPADLEPGGGLVVAGYQLAITLGAGVGGIVVDAHGIRTTLLLAAAAALVGGVLFGRRAGSAAPGAAAP